MLSPRATVKLFKFAGGLLLGFFPSLGLPPSNALHAGQVAGQFRRS